MGQIEERSSSIKMAKSSSDAKKSSKAAVPVGKEPINLCDPKVQGVLLVVLLAVLAIALWFGFTRGCLGTRRRRRRRSCSWYDCHFYYFFDS